ncbi:retrovirus-related pol polyprotein from transposon TNT 1-94 [Tanacetum coccineum]|uniref:Retrovirus-related pol polyprotein from transposon TNT 1-94 n=1 Tax=Tanacetum coccineum TaxID=301880 RepID=A0ABQ4Y2B8_9ASTR
MTHHHLHNHDLTTTSPSVQYLTSTSITTLSPNLATKSPKPLVITLTSPSPSTLLLIMEYLVNISKRRAFWSLNEDILKITILKTNTPYPSRKIRRIRACTHQRPQRNKAQYAVLEYEHLFKSRCMQTQQLKRWIAIERLQQGESLNVQDVKTNLFWEFGKFTSRDGESMESYYSRIAKSAKIHSTFLAAAQPYSDTYYQAPKPQRSNATSSSTRQSASTRHKGKEVAKPITPQSESVSEEDSDPEQAQRDKEMQKNLALLAKYFKKLYKPTNNNLRTSSNSRNKTEDTTPRYNNDNQSGQFGNQRTMTVAGTRETVGSPVVQQTGIQCFNCKGFGHYAKECRKPKRVKDYSYHKEKMMMCKQAEQGVPLQADWLADTDEEIDEQELEAHYSFMAKIQEVLPEESSSTEQPLEQVQNNDENNVFANERQHSKNNTAECADERRRLVLYLIANLTLDTEENKTILKQLKKANASLTQELEKCKTNLDETNSALGEAISCRDSCLIALQNKQNEFEKYKAFNDRTIDYEILQTKLNETLGLLALKDIEIKEGLKTKAYEISVPQTEIR